MRAVFQPIFPCVIRRNEIMLNMHSNKTKKTISTIIIILLVLAMVVPVVVGALI